MVDPNVPVPAWLAPFFDALALDVWLYDAGGRLVYQNPHSRRNWGGELGQRVDEMRVPKDVAERWRRTNARVAAGEVVTERVDYPTHHRTCLVVSVPLQLPDGQRGVVGLNVDITDQLRAEAAGQRQAAVLQAIFDASPILLGVRRWDGQRLVHVVDSAGWKEAWGLRPDEMAGRSAEDIGMPPEVLRVLHDTARRATASGRVEPYEVELTTADGVRRFHCAMAAVAPAVARLPPGESLLALVAEDVTEPRPLTPGRPAPATQAAAVLEVLARLDDTLAASSAAAPLDVGAARARLATALEGVRRLAGAQSPAQPRRPSGPGCDAVAVTQTVLQVAKAGLGASATLAFAGPARAPVAVSALDLGQVVLHLVADGARAASEAHPPAAARVELELRTLPDGWVELRMSDNGQRGDPGLGSLLSQRLVAGVGGELRLDEASTGGARVVVRLPPGTA